MIKQEGGLKKAVAKFFAREYIQQIHGSGLVQTELARFFDKLAKNR